MKRAFALLATLGFLVMVGLGCGKDKDSGVATVPTPPPPPPTGGGPIGSFNGQYSFAGNFVVQNQSLYQTFLRDNNVCEPYGTYYFTFGTTPWDCNNYQALFASIHLDSLELPATGYAQIYSYYLGVYAQLPPSQFNGNFSYIDQNTGFELLRRGYDNTYTWNAIIRYRIQGLPTDQTLNMEVYYRNQLLGIANLARQ